METWVDKTAQEWADAITLADCDGCHRRQAERIFGALLLCPRCDYLLRLYGRTKAR